MPKSNEFQYYIPYTIDLEELCLVKIEENADDIAAYTEVRGLEGRKEKMNNFYE